MFEWFRGKSNLTPPLIVLLQQYNGPVSIECVTDKLTFPGFNTFTQAWRHAKGAGHGKMELAHWMLYMIQSERTDIDETIKYFGVIREKIMSDLVDALGKVPKAREPMPEISNVVMDVLDRGWNCASLGCDEAQIRTGHLLLGIFSSRGLQERLLRLSAEFGGIRIKVLGENHQSI